MYNSLSALYYHVLASLILILSAHHALAAFPVANQPLPELKPAVAYNQKDYEFMSVYLVENSGQTWELKAQRYSVDGSPIGEEISPLGNVEHYAGGRPDIAYNWRSNTYYVAVPVRFEVLPWVWDYVLGLEIDASGTRIGSEDLLFNDKVLSNVDMSSILDFDSPTIARVTYNSVLNEYLVTFRRGVGEFDGSLWHQRVEVVGQRVNGTGLIGDIIILSSETKELDENWRDIDHSGMGEDAHAIGYAPILTTPKGGRYLFKY